MLQNESPVDYVLATGKTHSVLEFVQSAFESLGLNYLDHVIVAPQFYREAEKIPLCGDPSKAQKELNWARSKSFNEIVKEMVENDMRSL